MKTNQEKIIEFGLKFTAIDTDFYQKCASFANKNNGLIEELNEVEIINGIENKLYQLNQFIIPLDEAKKNKEKELWSKFKSFQHIYCDPEDLTLATALMLQKQPKGTAVAMWVQALWATYYELKSQLEACTTSEELQELNVTPEDYVDPPEFTILELNAEYNALMQGLQS